MFFSSKRKVKKAYYCWTGWRRMNDIEIVFAVYNGGDFLALQLDSIAAKDEGDWDLFARDDGSSDQSLNVWAAYSKRDARFHLISDGLGN